MTTLDCEICLNPLSNPQTINNCQHQFCKACLLEYIKEVVFSPERLIIPCPEVNCKVDLSNELLQSLLHKEIYNQYQSKLSRRLFQTISTHFYCPSASCSKHFKPDIEKAYTECTCGTKICNICCQERHEKKSCLENLSTRYPENIDNGQVKFCIICKTCIEKTVGCNQIKCPVCDFQFCWVCGREIHISCLGCPQKWCPIITQSNHKSFFNLLREILIIWFYFAVGGGILVLILAFTLERFRNPLFEPMSTQLGNILLLVAIVSFYGIILGTLLVLCMTMSMVWNWVEKKVKKPRWMNYDSELFKFKSSFTF